MFFSKKIIFLVKKFGIGEKGGSIPPFMYCVFHHISDHLQKQILFLLILQKNSWDSVRPPSPPLLGQNPKFGKGKIIGAPLTSTWMFGLQAPHTKWPWTHWKICIGGAISSKHTWIRKKRRRKEFQTLPDILALWSASASAPTGWPKKQKYQNWTSEAATRNCGYSSPWDPRTHRVRSHTSKMTPHNVF